MEATPQRATGEPATRLLPWFGLAGILLLSTCVNARREPQPRADLAPRPATFDRAVALRSRSLDGEPGDRYWAHEIGYSIDARLHEQDARVRAKGLIELKNRAPSPLQSVILRLDQNRFRSANAQDIPPESRTDGITIARMTVDGIPVALTTETDGRPRLQGATGTVAELLLRRPIEPGRAVRIEIEWHFEVPLDSRGSALRQGRWGNRTFQVAQWFPRIAMHDDLSGWDRFPFNGSVEFHNPFARFDVRIDVPADWPVGATGSILDTASALPAEAMHRLRALAESDSLVVVMDASGDTDPPPVGPARRTWRFVANDVTDFAWATSTDYAWLGTSVALADGRRIPVHLLATPLHLQQMREAATRLRDQLRFNSSLIVPFPFPQLTLVDGPEGGMEYPMLLMSAGDSRLAHELWHQWYPMLVGSDESRFAFLDEGLASFLAAVSDERRVAPVGRGVTRPRMREPLLRPEASADPSPLAALYGYARTGMMLSALRDSVGDSTLFRALRAYTTSWRHRHATPWDFMLSVERSTGRELGAFWHYWLYSVEMPM